MNKEYRRKRKRRLFDPDSKSAFKLSRTGLESFLRCPRCFYLDKRLGVSQPSMPPFTLNSAVDQLLKAEFDGYRMRGKPHPVMLKYGIEAVPLAHPLIDDWRNNFRGVQHLHAETNFLVFGAVDDIWVDPQGRWHVVDYKSTSTSAPITLDGVYKQAYKRQMEIYQWLLRQSKFHVSAEGYFVYCNADKTRSLFDSRLEFNMEVIPYEGKDDWVSDVIVKAKDCLMGDSPPASSEDCEYCRYLSAVKEVDRDLGPSSSSQGELFPHLGKKFRGKRSCE